MKRLLSTTSLARGAVIRKAGLAAALPFSLLAIAPVHADPMSMNDKMSMNDTMAMNKAMSIKVGGFFTQSIAAVDADSNTVSQEDEALNQNAEIHFMGKTMLNNGTVIGINIQLEAESSSDGDQIDEHYVYARGNWGKLIVGAENGVAHLGEVTAPGFVAGLKMADNSLTDAVIEAAYDTAFGASNVIEDANMSTKIENISGDANKVSYFTPRLGGLQLGVSFAPNNADIYGGESNFVAVSDGQQEDILEFSVNYKMYLMDGVRLKLGYTEAEGSTVGAGADPESYGYGAQIAYQDITFGVNQTTYENLGAVSGDKYAASDDIETTNYAVVYKMGASKFGIGYTDSEETAGADNIDYQELMIGGSTKISDGVSVGYYYQDTEASINEQDADVSLVGLTLALQF